MSIEEDVLPPKDADQWKQDACVVANILAEFKRDMPPGMWQVVQRFWRYLEADAFLPPEFIR